MTCKGRKPDINKYKTSRVSKIEESAQRNGPRKSIYSVDGTYYKGQWVNDLKQGKGCHKTPSYRYDGYWKNNKRHGTGICSKLNEETGYEILYDGEWKNGKPWGHGIRKFSDGGYYRGNWKNGQRQGTGHMWYPNDDYYAGTWYNGQRDGYGIFVYKNGNRYEGSWSGDLKQGKGKLYNFNTGLMQNGFWDKGIFKCGEIRNIYFRQAATNPTHYPLPEYKMHFKTKEEEEEEEERKKRAEVPIYCDLDEEILAKLKDDDKCLQELSNVILESTCTQLE